jgi:hypothetical protein
MNFLHPVDGLWLPASGRQTLKNKPNYFEIRNVEELFVPASSSKPMDFELW